MSITFLETKNLKKKNVKKKKFIFILQRKSPILKNSILCENLNIYIIYNGLYRAIYLSTKNLFKYVKLISKFFHVLCIILFGNIFYNRIMNIS